MDNSAIEWTDATWNPVTGCSKVSQGCKNCYALREWPRLSAPRPKPNIYTGREFTDVMCHPERLDQPLRWTKPRMIFVNSMSDLFHDEVQFSFIDQVFAAMALTPQHTYQILTKRPRRMLEYMTAGGRGGDVIDIVRNSEFGYRAGGDKLPPQTWPLKNVWLGVSIEDQETADYRIPLLLQTPAAVRWVSAEPLLGPINLVVPFAGAKVNALRGALPGIPALNWIVAGGESGPGARPTHLEWLSALRDQCDAADVPFFMKQITERGRKIPFENFPEDLQVREYPHVA